jgi:phage FluMu protein Com
MKNTEIGEQIRQRGFRRWYERQLIESHAYLLTAFLALILLLAGFEAMGALRGSPVYYVAIVGVAAGAGVLTWVAWQRFTALLARAELFANSAACPRCRVWGAFEVLAAEPAAADDPPEAGRPHWLRVRCRKCGEQWQVG